MERFKTLIGVLIAIGIIFGTFQQWTMEVPFGFTWFINMLWFAIGFPVLFGIGWIVFSLMAGGEKTMRKRIEEEE